MLHWHALPETTRRWIAAITIATDAPPALPAPISRRQSPRRALILTLVLASVMAVAGGCSSKSGPPPLPPPVKATTRIVIVDDSELAKAIREEWSSVSEDKIAVREMTSAQAWKAKRLDADVVFYPSSMLGHLTEAGLLRPLDNQNIDEDDGDPADLLLTLKNHELTWDGKLMALPLGSPLVTLMYRADVFEELKLAVPTTWSEYATALEVLDKHLKSQPDNKAVATIEPRMGGAAPLILLARAAAYSRREGSFAGPFDYRSLRPLINRPPFVRALNEMIAAARNSPGGEKHSFQSARQALKKGRTMMALSWPTRADASEKSDKSIVHGFGILPGSNEVFRFESNSWMTLGQPRSIPLLGIAGRLGSLTSEARRPREATETLTWITGKRLGAAIGSRSSATTLFRRSHLAAAASWVGSSVSTPAASRYAAVVSQASQQNVVMHAIRLPGREEYLTALDRAVANAMAGEKPAQQALDEAARKWDEISERLGRDKQKQAYRRSYGG